MKEKTIALVNKEQLNTEDAREQAMDASSIPTDVAGNWWNYFAGYRLKKWKKEITRLSEKTGVSFKAVMDYMGKEKSGEGNQVSFYRKLPKRRETYIGIGMAYGLPLEKINSWLKKYGGKRQLYVKDVLEDLAWIYLINSNYESREPSKNYFLMYEECLSVIEETYYRMWASEGGGYVPTEDLDEDIRYVSEDEDYRKLRRFVEEHASDFASAYSRPRQLLKDRVQAIVDVMNLSNEGRRFTLNGLRGYLDDSMINYLSGTADSINTIDKAKKKTPGFKQMPKNKKSHIALCLALGMTTKAIDEYLVAMGYARLDAVDSNEGVLLNLLEKWDKEHTLPRLLREGKLTSDNDKILAVKELLMMRQDLKHAYESYGFAEPFPYMYN